MPVELGNLSHLELLTLHGNAGLLGALPETLTKITGLHRLTFDETGLCAPLDENFQAWLIKIPDRQGPNCLPESSTNLVTVRDMFGRVVNETGIVLVDWEGHIANPAMKYFVELPGATATLSSSEPRLYFDLPSSTGASGPTKALTSEDPTQAAEFHISIFPDRDTSDESHTLTIRYVGGGGRVSSQTIDVRVIDQDVDRPLEFDVIPDFRHDETGMFDDPAAREAVQQAANDFAYFIADMSLDEVPAGEELMEIELEYPNSPDNRTVTNAVTYTGFLMHVYGLLYDDLTAGGGPSPDGRNQSSGGVELPIKRSGSITFDPRGNFTPVGWLTSVPESDWWKATNLGGEPHDLYSIALHEMGHALVFNPGHDGFAGFYDVREVRDNAVRAYYGAYPAIDRYHHLPGTIDPVSRRGAYGNEYGAETPHGRWIVTKLDLLVAQAVGYALRDTSPFSRLSILDEPLSEGSAGTLYTHTVNVVGGIPAYYWSIDSGALPDGLSLDSFTGTISGTPQESGTFEFTIRVRDNTEGNEGVVRAVNLNIGDGPSDSSDEAVLLAARDTLAGTATLNWSADVPIGQWEGVTVRGTPERVTRLNLDGKDLSGMIPSVLGRLSMLTYLNLRSNDGLTGEIPSELGYLSNLKVLNLHSNSHSGSIPDLSGMTSLEELYLANNDLTGSIPTWLNGMTNMEELWLWGNSLTGTVPNLSGMTSLQKLKLANNMLTGGVPEASTLPPNMTWLIIDRNPFGGTIPDLSSLTRLRLLWLHSNGLTGEIPEDDMLPASLDDLNLRDNTLTGEIPDLSNLDRLTRLRLHNNSLSGEVPATLGDLDMLRQLWLHNEVDKGLGNNSFTSIAAELGDLSDTLIEIALNGNSWADDACVPVALANVAKNDYADAGLEVCESGDGS